jgi:hypothetical protein
MASKLKTEVRINESHTLGTGISIPLDPMQALLVLERLAAGEVLYINLVTTAERHREDPKLYAAS